MFPAAARCCPAAVHHDVIQCFNQSVGCSYQKCCSQWLNREIRAQMWTGAEKHFCFSVLLSSSKQKRKPTRKLCNKLSPGLLQMREGGVASNLSPVLARVVELEMLFSPPSYEFSWCYVLQTGYPAEHRRPPCNNPMASSLHKVQVFMCQIPLSHRRCFWLGLDDHRGIKNLILGYERL